MIRLDDFLQAADSAYVDLDLEADFNPNPLKGYYVIDIPSIGSDRSNVYSDKSKRALHLSQWAEALLLQAQGGTFINYLALDEWENEYRHKLFPNRAEQIDILSDAEFNEIPENGLQPLDKYILNSPKYLTLLKKIAAKAKQRYPGKVILFGYTQTDEMMKIAEFLEIPYLGKPEFAAWAGTKAGLQEFTELNGLPSPHTITIRSLQDIKASIDYLRGKKYSRAVFKVNFSTGSVGHRLVSLDALETELQQGTQFTELIPPQYKEGEGLVLQGWLERSEISGMSSLDIMVWPNGKVEFVHLKTKFYRTDQPGEPAGYLPILRSQFEEFKRISTSIQESYAKAMAVGPHSINLMHINQEAVDKHEFTPNIPLIHDENSRIGSSKIAHSWAQALRQGQAGTGWAYCLHQFSEKKAPRSSREVITSLKNHKLLLAESTAGSSGIYPYGIKRLDYGVASVPMLSISSNSSTRQALDTLTRATRAIETD